MSNRSPLTAFLLFLCFCLGFFLCLFLFFGEQTGEKGNKQERKQKEKQEREVPRKTSIKISGKTPQKLPKESGGKEKGENQGRKQGKKKRRSRLFFPKDFRFSSPSSSFGPPFQQQVENVVAVRSSLRDHFKEEDILEEKFGRLFVSSSLAKGMESEPVSYNRKTRHLGVITGVLAIRFQSLKAFKKRKEILNSFFSSTTLGGSPKEIKSFRSIFLSLVKLELSGSQKGHFLERLRHEAQNLEKEKRDIRSVRVEIIETLSVPL